VKDQTTPIKPEEGPLWGGLTLHPSLRPGQATREGIVLAIEELQRAIAAGDFKPFVDDV